MWASWLQVKWCEGILAPSWLQVGAKLGKLCHVETKLGPVGVLGPLASWGQVEPTGGKLEPSWGQVGAKWGQDEAKIGLRAPALDSAVASYSDFKMRQTVLLDSDTRKL